MRARALMVAALLTTAIASLFAQSPQPQAGQGRMTGCQGGRLRVANSMGMLRSLQQEDSIITLEQWGSGKMTVGTQAFEIFRYRMSVNYAVPGMRVDLDRKGQNGQAQRQIQVVSAAHAWDEADRGVNATPAQATLKERLVQLWTSPIGLVKAARAAGANATVTVQGSGNTLLSFALPPPANDVTVVATLRTDPALLVTTHELAAKGLVGTYLVKVETAGAIVSETTYAEYGDWNWDDYKADIFQPKRMVRKLGNVMLEIVTTNTNTYNPYVVMPVPGHMRQVANLAFCGRQTPNEDKNSRSVCRGRGPPCADEHGRSSPGVGASRDSGGI